LVSAAALSRVLVVGWPCFSVGGRFLTLPSHSILALPVADCYTPPHLVFTSVANQARSHNDAKVKAPLLLDSCAWVRFASARRMYLPSGCHVSRCLTTTSLAMIRCASLPTLGRSSPGIRPSTAYLQLQVHFSQRASLRFTNVACSSLRTSSLSPLGSCYTSPNRKR